jgi:hypothetical protein
MKMKSLKIMQQLYKNSGISLLIGSFLMVATMVLHPFGGSFEQLLAISTMTIVSHSIAIFSIPFTLFGFWGLTKRLEAEETFAKAAFITAALGLIAAMLAAAVNGLVLPFFIEDFRDASQQTIEQIKPILRYGFALNKAFDFILIGGLCEGFLLWSIAILKTKEMPKWIGYLGILLGVGFLTLLLSGFVLTSLYGFRLFVFGIVLWIIATAIYLMKAPRSN